LSAAAPAASVDWCVGRRGGRGGCAARPRCGGVVARRADVRAKMVSDEARSLIDKAETTFRAREAVVAAQGAVPAIDWDHFRAALPHLDVDAIASDFNKVLNPIPAVEYDETADKARHEAVEASFDDLVHYAQQRVQELKLLQQEAAEHKLDDDYSVARAFQRFDGLFEREWAEYRNANFESSLRSFSEIPDDLSIEQKREVAAKFAKRLGTSSAKLGVHLR
jgi:hypothetical protein